MQYAGRVRWPVPLTREPPFYPGQMQTGVPGADNITGLRHSTEGRIFYVDPNHPDPNDQRDGTHPMSPLATIGAALTHCQPHRGDTIAVMDNAGWYYDSGTGAPLPIRESVTVNVAGVRIVGVTPSGAVGVTWELTTQNQVAITINECDVLIEGFAFVGNSQTGQQAILAQYVGNFVGDNVVIRNNYFDNDLWVGIHLDFVYHARIHGNKFREIGFADATGYGIYNPATDTGIQYCHIYDNIFDDVKTTAILADGAERNYIFNNHFYNANSQAGLASANSMIDLDASGGAAGGENMVCWNFMSCLDTVPANGDYADSNRGQPTDAWIRNCLMDAFSGPAVP